MKLDSKEAKLTTLRQIAGGRQPIPAGKAKFRIGRWLVHTRYCSENLSAPDKYKFNVNPNTLSSDFELWICGKPEDYYLMPTSLMNEIYDHPHAYVDQLHPDIRVVSVDLGRHSALYARGGTAADLTSYFRGELQ